MISATRTLRWITALSAGSCALVLLGCASAPSKPTNQQETTLKLSATDVATYAKPVAPVSLRLSETEARRCPRGVLSVKGLNWKDAVMLGSACVAAEQWTMVENIGQTLAVREPLAPWGAYFLSLAAESRGDLPRAVWMNELALKKSPSQGLLLYQQGRLLWKARDRQAAIKSLRQAVSLDARLVDAHVLLGQLALIERDYKSAEKHFGAALAIEPRLLAGLLGHAESQVAQKNSKSAVESLTTVVLHYPSHVRARLRLAEILETMEKNLPEALAVYKRLRALEKEKRLDGVVSMDLEGKIRQLESIVTQHNLNQVSQAAEVKP